MAHPSPPLLPDVRAYFQQYFPRVFAYIYGRVHDTHATEDLASEAFKRVFAGARRLPDEEAFAIRLFTTARDLLVSHLRAQTRTGAAQPQDNVGDAVLKRTDLPTILGLLRRFPQQEQDIIALKFDAELTNAQIAEVVGISEGNVRTILYHTLRKLRKALEREG